MRQSHAAGDKLFVDYARDGVPVVIDRLTGERRAAQIFAAVLGASSFTYAQATWTQGPADWISGHVGVGGVPAPDNTRVAVIEACRYDPQINRSYARYGGTLRQRHSAGQATRQCAYALHHFLCARYGDHKLSRRAAALALRHCVHLRVDRFKAQIGSRALLPQTQGRH